MFQTCRFTRVNMSETGSMVNIQTTGTPLAFDMTCTLYMQAAGLLAPSCRLL